MAIEFTPTTTPTGFEIFDSNEQRRLRVKTDGPVTISQSDTDRFCFPVDSAVTVETSSLLIDQYYLPHIHDEAGIAKHSIDAGDEFALEDRTQFVGLNAPIKVYCRIPASGVIETSVTAVKMTFDEPVPIEIGARSLHEKPRGTIRTPDDPESMMTAVSHLSSALKTTSPERSWPTLRGHPPLIERGSELEIPDTVAPMESDVSIEIPPTYANLYTVAPLSFYLGATIQPGKASVLKTERTTYELGVERHLQDDTARLLKRVFLLDCIVRTEGVIQDDLYERTELEEELPFDLANVYDEPQSVRLDRYLDVPFRTLEPFIPRWPLTAHIPSTAAGVEILPFLINQLGVVREPESRPIEDPSWGHEGAEEAFVRSAVSNRSPMITQSDQPNRLDFVDPEIDDSVEHAWFGSGIPRGASKATIEAYRNKLSRNDRNESIDILVVCNDAQMLAEHDILDETYGTRELLPFDVTSKFGVSTDELAALLTNGGYDFLHYIGHATESGLRCPDGELDVRSLTDVDVGVFFLNACRSYTQGLELARRGAFGGIVTLSDVVNDSAVEVGGSVARLLDLGFPLRAALELVRETNVFGSQYLIVGDGSADIAQANVCSPTIEIIDRRDDDMIDYMCRTYPTKESQIGITNTPTLDEISTHFLGPGESPSSRVSQEAVQSQSFLSRTPRLVDGRLEWTDRFDVCQLL